MNERRGRPFNGETKKSIARTARLEPAIVKAIEEDKRFGSFQKFVDHYSYKLAPERKPTKRKK